MDNQHNPNNTPTCNGISAHDKKISFLVAEDHGQRILTVLQSFRAQNIFFDFKILVKDEAIPCHRCVLAACSDFFRAMFEVNMKERDDGSVMISNLTPKAVKAFLDYAYTGKTEITNDNVEMFFQLSSFLQISLLSKACSDFLIKNIDLVNCLQLLSISESYGSTKLFEHTLKYAQLHFSLLLQSNDLLEMNFEILQKCIEADELNVPDEESVLKAAFWWTKHDLETRHKYLLHLMKKIRLHQLPEKTLQDILLSEEQFLKATNCLVIIKEAIQNVQSFSGLFPDPRPSTTEKYILVHKTEENKMNQHTFCYNIKTDQWKELMNINIFDLPGSSLSSYGEKIFITGGCKGNCFRTIRLHIAETFHDATDQTWCYCPANDSFSLVSAMKKPRTMHTSVVTLNRLYVIGGKTRASQDIKSLLDVEAYNPVSREWKSVSPLPRGIYYPEASACHSVIYVLGSEVEITDAFNPSLDCFFKYNAATDQWSQLVAEFGQFFHATLIKAIPVNCTLYICDLSTYKVYSFCPETCVWKGEGSFECAGFNAGAVGIEDKIYILGGDYAPDEITDEVQVYHSSRSEWEEVAPMPKALTEFHCQVIQFNKFRDPWLQKQCDTNNYTRRSDLVAATAATHVVTPKSSSPSTSSIRRMKTVKKILGLGRKKNEQQSPSRSRVVACASAPGALPVRPVTCPKHVHVEDCMNVSLKATRKSENKRRNSKQKVSQQLSNNLHQPQDESSLSEASLEERYPAKSVSGKNKLYRTLSITNDLDDLTPSSESTAEDIESLSSIYKEAIVLIEELSLDCKDSVSLLKVQNIFHGYQRPGSRLIQPSILPR